MRKGCLLFTMSALIYLTIKCSENTTATIIEDSVTDINGNTYMTIEIGTQHWMSENLKVTRFRNGEPIANVESNNEWSALSEGAYCIYQNDTANIDSYGLLYNWYAVNSPLNIAPKGWHVASDDEWKELEIYLGMNASESEYTGFRGTDQGDQLKNGDFKALTVGFRGVDGYFSDAGKYGYWWTSTEFCRLNAWYHGLTKESTMVNRNFDAKIGGFSVRCLKD